MTLASAKPRTIASSVNFGTRMSRAPFMSVIRRDVQQPIENGELVGQAPMTDDDALGLSGAARGEDDQSGIAQQFAIRRRRLADRVEPVAVEQKARAGYALHPCDGRRRSQGMDRHGDRTGLPDTEQRAEVGRPVADADMNGLMRRDMPLGEGMSHAFGKRQKAVRLLRLATRACDGMTGRLQRIAENLGKRAAHAVRSGNRASRQASAALRPSRRAISMNWVLSGEPAPSIARSMASPSSRASSILRASKDRLMARLVCLTRLGSIAAMWFAMASPARSSSADATMRLTMPTWYARAAAIRSSPNRMISLAILGPTTHGNIKATMPAPNLSSGSPKNASSAAMVMSQASASSQAPARHGPRTIAMVGSGKCQKRMMVSKSLRKIARQASTPTGRRSICSLRSKPDENAAPEPVTISARKPASRSISSSAVPISPSMAALSALARSGRARVRRATAPIFSTVIVAKRPVMGSPLPRPLHPSMAAAAASRPPSIDKPGAAAILSTPRSTP